MHFGICIPNFRRGTDPETMLAATQTAERLGWHSAFTTDHVADDPAESQLWPEHFDLATTMAEVNYGCSAGDDGHPWPYLYVGPWSPPAQGGFWNEPFGASLSLEDVPLVGEVLEFFARGRVADR